METINISGFLNEYDNRDREFLNSVINEYITDDILSDPYRMRSLIGMAKTMLQADKIDTMINRQLSSSSPDAAMVSKLSSIKNTFLSSISAQSNEVCISSKGAAKAAPEPSLTRIMREMYESGFETAKADYLSAKMSRSYKEIADANAKALIDELKLTGDEYAQLTAQQSEIISALQERIEELEEEIRRLRINRADK